MKQMMHEYSVQYCVNLPPMSRYEYMIQSYKGDLLNLQEPKQHFPTEYKILLSVVENVDLTQKLFEMSVNPTLIFKMSFVNCYLSFTR